MIEFQQDVLAVFARTTAFFDFGGHRARHHIAAGEVFDGGRVTLHETLAVFVEQKPAFTTHAFSDQHASAGHARWVKLPELHIFKRYARARRHTLVLAE